MKLLEPIAYDPVPWAIRIIGWGAVLSLVTCAGYAIAASDLMARHPNGKDTVRLSQTKPCTNKVALSNIPTEHRKKARSGTAFLEGAHYPFCWLLSPQKVVLIAYEDGDVGYIAFSYFEPLKEF